MNDHSRYDKVKRTLDEYAAQAIPESLDLWPAISNRLQAGQSHPRPGARPLSMIFATWANRRVSLLAFTATLLFAVIAVTGVPFGDRQIAPATAAEALSALGEVAASQPLTEGGGRYRYSRWEESYLRIAMVNGVGTLRALESKTHEEWTAVDGSGRIRETPGTLSFLSERDRSLWKTAGLPETVKVRNVDFGPGERSRPYENIRNLPPDATVLADRIREQASKPGGPPVDVEMFVIVGDLLRDQGISPEFRAALFKVAAGIENVELVGNITDRAGRRGVGVAMTTTYWGQRERIILIFDPATSALFSQERTVLEQVEWVDAEPPVVIGHATYLESRMVPELP